MKPQDHRSTPQTLMIDADDTLWENNIYFEQAIAGFIGFLNHREYSREQVREVLNAVERETIAQHGYGLHSFRQALVTTFERLSLSPVTPQLHETIGSFSRLISEHPLELMEGVHETLRQLAQRHHLILLTKGNVAEQAAKVEQSGLQDYFAAREIVAEKDAPAYRSICDKYGFPGETTWMVGNSPRSDINPALQAGLNAVFIPHSQTWVLEHEELAGPGKARKLLVLQKFGHLTEHF